jgi:hypothetical protein
MGRITGLVSLLVLLSVVAAPRTAFARKRLELGVVHREPVD